MSQLVNWRRQRKNRYGPDVITVRVLGKTQAGYFLIERMAAPKLREIVHARNLEAILS